MIQELYKDMNWLTEQYQHNNLSIRKIAKLINAASTTVLRWMDEYNIPRRDLKILNSRRTENVIYRDRNWLVEQYWGFDLSLEEMGKIGNCCGPCIKYWMGKYNIPIKPKFHHLKKLNQNPYHQSKAGKARAKWTNDHYAHLARERLLKNNIGYLTHVKWKERDPEGYYQHQLKGAIKAGEIMRERLTDWDFYHKHGCLKSQFPYPDKFNKKLKKQIFNRDGGCCQFCHKLICNGWAIHHIDYDKTNNDPINLILLCPSCHSKTGFNRGYWKDYFEKLKEKPK